MSTPNELVYSLAGIAEVQRLKVSNSASSSAPNSAVTHTKHTFEMSITRWLHFTKMQFMKPVESNKQLAMQALSVMASSGEQAA